MKITKDELLSRINEGWDKFQAYLASLSPEMLTQPRDAAGWTIKDHLSHIAVWEDGIAALLQKKSRNKQMGLSDELWASPDYDAMNAQIRENHKDLSLEETRALCDKLHAGLVKSIEALSDEDLNRPYQYFAPDSEQTEPVWGWIVGNSFEHYAEHTPWIAAIAAKA